MTENTRVHPACPDASNPFHECAQYCLQKIAESGKTSKEKKGSITFGRRKKESGSQPVSPLPNGGLQLNFLNKKKMGHNNYGEHSSSSQTPSEENSSRDSSFNKKHESPLLVPVSANLKPAKEPSNNSGKPAGNDSPTKQEELHTPPTRHSNIVYEDVEGQKSLISEAKSFTSLVAVQDTEGSDDDADSVISDFDDCVRVGNYHVKSCVSSTLKSVFDKHGDIAAECQLESLSLRAYYLESVCFVIQELQSTPFKYLTKSKVKEMLAILKDVESAQINVGWLRHVLKEVAEALNFVGQQRVAEVTKANSDRDFEKTKKELKLQMETLAQKEQEVADARAKVAETKSHLAQVEQKSSQLKEIIFSLISKVEKINCKALLDEIL